MNRALRVVLGGLLLTPLVCLAVVRTQACPPNPGCTSAGPLMQAMGLGSRTLEVAIAGLLMVTALRCAATLRRTAAACAGLAAAPTPASLRDAQLHTGVRRVHCVADAPLPAFCHGGLRPVIVITAAAVGSLPPTALEAVLLHEETHRRRRDPLRRALRRALADLAPRSRLVLSCNARALIHEELRADARAARRLGRPAVARALLATAPAASQLSTVAGFGDAASPRIEQLLGGTPRLPAIPVDCAVRAVGALAAVAALLLCGVPGAS